MDDNILKIRDIEYEMGDALKTRHNYLRSVGIVFDTDTSYLSGVTESIVLRYSESSHTYAIILGIDEKPRSYTFRGIVRRLNFSYQGYIDYRDGVNKLEKRKETIKKVLNGRL